MVASGTQNQWAGRLLAREDGGDGRRPADPARALLRRGASGERRPGGARPFTVFVSRGGWPYYARPRLGHDEDHAGRRDVRAGPARGAGTAAVHRVGARLHALLRAAALAAGVEVGDYPLLVLDRRAGAPPEPHRRASAAAGDPDLATVPASVHVGFGQDDTGTGPASVAERDAMAHDPAPASTRGGDDGPGPVRHVRRLRPRLGAVGGGSHNPRGDVTEIVGVGVLPAQRRRGIAGHLTWALAADAADAGVRTCSCPPAATTWPGSTRAWASGGSGPPASSAEPGSGQSRCSPGCGPAPRRTP